MVKDVVKSEFRMIDMWSSVSRVVEAPENRSAGREETCSEQRTNTLTDTCGQSAKKMMNMWSGNNQSVKSRELPCPSSVGVVL